jgi:ribonuclease Z
VAEMILLGVGTAVADAERDTTHMVWIDAAGPLLIDCGGSSYQRLLRAGIDPLALRGVVLTHGHADHIHGLPVLLFQLAIAGYQGALPVIGSERTLALMRRIIEAFDLGEHQAAVAWQPVVAGDELMIAGPGVRVRSAETIHPWPALALRFEHAGSSLTYSADTEPCAAVEELARGTTTLIHEATTPGPSLGHTSPHQAGAVAARCGAERLVLVHFSNRYTASEQQAIAEVRAAGFSGEASVGQEGQVIALNG